MSTLIGVGATIYSNPVMAGVTSPVAANQIISNASSTEIVSNVTSAAIIGNT